MFQMIVPKSRIACRMILAARLQELVLSVLTGYQRASLSAVPKSRINTSLRHFVRSLAVCEGRGSIHSVFDPGGCSTFAVSVYYPVKRCMGIAIGGVKIRPLRNRGGMRRKAALTPGG